MKDVNIKQINKTDKVAKFVKGNIINPFINSLLIQPEQALSNTLKNVNINLKQINELPVKSQKFLSSGWFSQNLASGLGMVLPYAILGKVANVGLSQVGEVLASNSIDVKFMQNEILANSLAAFGYGYEQNVPKNQSHLANALSNGFSFAVYGVGDKFIAEKSLLEKLPGLALVGASGSVVGLSIENKLNNNTLPTFKEITQAAVSGAALNIALPTTIESLSKLQYKINDKLELGNYVGSYLTHNYSKSEIAQFPEIKDLSEKYPWAKIYTSKKMDIQSQAHSNKIDLALTHRDLPALYHEMIHIEQIKNINFDLVNKYLSSGNLDKAFNEFANMFYANEAQAHIGELTMEKRLNNAVKVLNYDEMIAQLKEDKHYQQKVREEFKNYYKNGKKPSFYKIDGYKYQEFIAHDWEEFTTSQKIKLIDGLSSQPINIRLNVLVNAINEHDNLTVNNCAFKYFDKLSTNDKINIFKTLIKNDNLESKLTASRLIAHLPKAQRLDAFKEFLKSDSNLVSQASLKSQDLQYWRKTGLIKRLNEEVILSIKSLSTNEKSYAFDLSFQKSSLISNLAKNLDILPESQRLHYFNKINNYLKSRFYPDSNYEHIQNGLINSIKYLQSEDRFDALNSLIPKLKKFSVNDLSSAFETLNQNDKIQIWNNILSKTNHIELDKESLEFLSRNIVNLPQNLQLNAFKQIESICTNPNYLMNSLNLLDERDQLRFLSDTIKRNPKEQINYYSFLKNIPFNELPNIVDKISNLDKSGFNIQSTYITDALSRIISNIENLNTLNNENTLKDLITIIGKKSNDTNTLKNLFSIIKEIPEPFDETRPYYAPVAEYLANNVNPEILGKILFNEDPAIGIKIAKQYPKYFKKTFSKQFYTFVEDDHALNVAAKSFYESGNIIQAIQDTMNSYKVDNLDYPKNETVPLHIARLFKYFSKSLSNNQKEALYKYLSDVTKSHISTQFSYNKNNDTINTELAIMIASEIGKSNPAQFNRYFVEPINHYIESNKVEFQQKYNLANIIAVLVRHDKLQPNIFKTPEFKISSQLKLNPEEKIKTRNLIELALHGEVPLTDIVGDNGVLGQMYPHIFGNFETNGGFIGRPQHGFHEFELGLHSQKVLENVRQNKLFKDLSSDDQINLLYAAYFHDIGKEAGVVDPEHDLKSAKYLKSALKELGYSSVRIQRIFKLMQYHAEISYEPHVNTLEKLNNDELFSDLMTYNFRTRISQIQARILNESDIRSINSTSSYYTQKVNEELDGIDKYLRKQSSKLNKNFVPILTSKIPNRFTIQELDSNYNLLVHYSPVMNTSFIDQISLIESPKSSLSTSFITPQANRIYNVDTSPSLVAIFESSPENVSQASFKNEGTGRNTSEIDHINLIKDWNHSQTANSIIAKINRNISTSKVRLNIDVLRDQFLKYDSLDSLLAKEPVDSPIRKLNSSIITALTTDLESHPIKNHNEIKISDPVLVGFGILRRGHNINFESLDKDQFKTMFLSDSIPAYVQFGKAVSKPNESEPLSISKRIIEFAQARQIPILVLDK